MASKEKGRKKGRAPEKTVEELKEELNICMIRRDIHKLERQLEYKRALLRGENVELGEACEEEREYSRRIKNIRALLYIRK